MTIRVLAVLLTLITATSAFAGAANAEEEGEACGNSSEGTWLSEDALRTKAESMGYKVRSMKAEGGCYEVYAIDNEGNRVEAHMNPVTGELFSEKVGG